MFSRRRRCAGHVMCVAVILLILLAFNVLAYFILEYRSADSHGSYYADTLSQTNQATEEKLIRLASKDETETKKIPSMVVQNLVNAQDHSYTASSKAAKKVLETADEIAHRYNISSLAYIDILKGILNSLKINEGVSRNLATVTNWVTGTQVVPENATELGSLLNTLCSLKITKADISRRGTQLKLLLTLEGGWKALFKPQWYERDMVISGPVYSGKDRHNAEVAAFHLSLLLGMRRVPLTVGRRVDLRREVIPVATPVLRNTFLKKDNNTCFYGVCHYCMSSDPVCAKGDTLEGALILWLPQKIAFARFNHPWQRTYKDHLLAKWEVETKYCEKVKKTKAYDLDTSQRLIDLIDTAVFDFLIDNGDRHHYEAPLNFQQSHVFLFDNGKSFGDPSVDHLDIIAPLYQCCLLRKKTWENLFNFRGGVLGSSLEQVMNSSHISPVLTNEHLHALDRRLLLVFAAVEVCLRDNPNRSVLI